ncbi:MAG: DUF4139 domain-containing protein [Candidatus Omnitrophica bacterium]|nr:DUF4139 domain-containing protein [Candidatus Omnitrophota bacterium]MBU1047677.1 DUF4139 domain-containing protein [Candidatus Omnitrophota bacterium]MBU1631506.1 DUF4139 domain-containing protein [Candidatus Omnitrophota bacterium]MBU1767333.1 DUF4139 domain-containing protein [Candidatus Omnitrophota bacterium]MBU1888593.1 DUF4139 domain-containing protein [Candidatus Omnitrophota bacterium]
MKRIILFLVVSFLVVAGACSAAAPLKSTIDDQEQIYITIYNNNLGLVKDIREIYLPRGISELQFMDVAQKINPTTVHIKSLIEPDSLSVLEQNYEYDLLNPAKLLDKYVGQKVKLVGYSGEEGYDAILLSTNQGYIYKINDEIHINPGGRVILPKIPENLIAKPTLVWMLNNTLRSKQKVEASYLTDGINWKADYVAILNKDDTKADLTGWVTIDNKSGAGYKDATIQLIAGDVNRVTDEGKYDRSRIMMEKASVGMDSLGFAEKAFFEYHIYTLGRKSTIKENQTKQISLLEASDIPIKKNLIFYGAEYYYRNRYGEPISNQKVGVYIDIENKKENNLGMPFPKGIVRVYKEDHEGRLQFVGEDRIDHTPKDETIEIKMGEAFDVVGERTQMDWKKIASNVYEAEWEISIRNHKEEDAEVQIIEPIPGDWTILKSSHKYEKIEAHTLKYTVKVPKDGEVKITYRVRMTW